MPPVTARTMVYVSTGVTYFVAESVAEVTKLWLAAGQAYLNDEAAVVELTNVTSYWDPYPVVISPTAISHMEEAQPDQVEYSAVKTKERWEEFSREIGGKSTGFGSE